MATTVVTDLKLASSNACGLAGNLPSEMPSLSGDGSKVVFTSFADNLVPNDTNSQYYDVFVKDMLTGDVEMINRADDGTQITLVYPTISDDGNTVSFSSGSDKLPAGYTNGLFNTYVKDLTTGRVTLVSCTEDGTLANGSSGASKPSADGTKVAFSSLASNLVPGDTNGKEDVFVKDLTTGTVTLVSQAADGSLGDGASSGLSLSADGTKIAFGSNADNLVPGDMNGSDDLFVKDLTTGALTLVSQTADGLQTPGVLSTPSISDDGTKVAFSSDADNFAPGDTNNVEDVFVKDLVTGELRLLSLREDGTQALTQSVGATISGDGTKVAFTSAADLVARDSPFSYDLYVMDLVTGEATLVSETGDGVQGDLWSFWGAISADGTKVGFESYADNLSPNDGNGTQDIFVATLGPLEKQTLTGTAKADRLTGGRGGDTVSGLAGDDLLDGLGGADRLYGGPGNDRLWAGSGSDVVKGGSGNDLLDGGDDADPDRLFGGSGNDQYRVNGPEDVIVEHPGQGTDTVVATYAWALGPNLENLTLRETGASANGFAIGNRLANRLTGNSGDNRLDGRAGDDTLIGRGGNDRMWAGTGNDLLDGGAGNDVLGGGPGADSLLGGVGNDTLYAGVDAAPDTLAGGAGDDVYWIYGSDISGSGSASDSDDIIRENSGEGTDTVFITRSYRLGAWIENATVLSGACDTGVTVLGNALPNRLTGNDAANTLDGGVGNDTLLGMAGNDLLNAGSGDDLSVGGGGDDTLGPVGLDRSYGSPTGRDTLIGGAGDDLLNAGGTPARQLLVNFDDEPDLMVFGRGKDGFGRDTVEGFDEAQDRIVFVGYSREDLVALVTLSDVAPYPRIEGAMSWVASFSFEDGSALRVTGVAQGMPSLAEGSDYVFASSAAPQSFTDAGLGRQVSALASYLPGSLL